jgi:hypothetical protein
MSQENPHRARVSRRNFLAAGAAVATAAVAGCTEGTINWFADKVFKQVNVLNNTDRELNGSIAVTGPDGETVLDETFSIDAEEQDVDEEGSGVFGDVWTTEGSYEVSVELDDPVDDVTGDSETVSISEPDNEILVVVVGSDDLDSTVAFRVGDSFTDAVPGQEDS